MCIYERTPPFWLTPGPMARLCVLCMDQSEGAYLPFRDDRFMASGHMRVAVLYVAHHLLLFMVKFLFIFLSAVIIFLHGSPEDTVICVTSALLSLRGVARS